MLSKTLSIYCTEDTTVRRLDASELFIPGTGCRMWRVFRAVTRPEYFFRPKQICRRLARRYLAGRPSVQLAWNLPVTINPSCHTGGDILNLGVFDRVVPETIFRLLDAGETGFDVGANIGQNTSIMAMASGPQGQVTAFEPHPQLFPVLQRNTARWVSGVLSPIEIHELGLSSRHGQADLCEPAEFPGNQGSASLNRPVDTQASYPIQITTLDSMRSPSTPLHVMKLDVEGHEPSVLEGASEHLACGNIRDVIYEEFAEQPGPVTQILERYDYTVFKLYAAWSRPKAIAVRESTDQTTGFFSHNYLATRNPERAIERLKAFGWRCLKLW